MHTSRPLPVCRRAGCADDAVGPHGYCVAHDLQYARWRVWRDQTERDDLTDAGVLLGQEPDETTARALDALWQFLTPGPFPKRPK